MKNTVLMATALLITGTLQSCGLVEGIFKAGMWWAFFLVALVIILLIWLLRKTK